MNARDAQREAFKAVPETCPKVDAALETAAEAIKEQTGMLRDALIEALERAITAEARIADLEYALCDLERDVERLQDELKEAQA